ncbi:hypothetical protein FN846DRAFT_959627 [Sphaerosporella brunnea]|uniref:Secreted protein n=1 Tax=Sphaerosporella brunnea TaxID=1250544 RepID=A0A5J5EPR6_9PEZI|nr:hypothetical protein FN846DRAFT_959627 [Sphaerosporella brunnea]
MVTSFLYFVFSFVVAAAFGVLFSGVSSACVDAGHVHFLGKGGGVAVVLKCRVYTIWDFRIVATLLMHEWIYALALLH